jgi:hypothetical protein
MVKHCSNCTGRKLVKLSLFLLIVVHQFCGVINCPPFKDLIVSNLSLYFPKAADFTQRHWVLLLSVLLVSFAHNATAQNMRRENNQYTTTTPSLKGEPVELLDGPWQTPQSSVVNTPETQARTEIVAVLANLLASSNGDMLHQPEVISINIIGRSATAVIDSQNKDGLIKDVVRLRFNSGVWQIIDIGRL